MRTFLQLLRIAFWMLPIQRALTLLGAAIVLVSFFVELPVNPPGSSLPSMFLGVMLVMIVPLVAGGAFFRMLSAPRSVLVLPRAKPRLLTGMIAVACGSTLIWILAYVFTMRRYLPPDKQPDLEAYGMMFVLTLAFATQASIGIFVASRGPLCALLVLAAWQLPAIVLNVLGVDDAPRLLTGWVGFAGVAVSWTIFAAWYLRARRIGGIGWSLRGKDSVLTQATVERRAPLTREQAMERWLLGASTPLRIGAQWLAGAALLIAIQWLLGRSSPPRAVSAMAFGTLSLCTAVTGAIAYSIAVRSRGLWLNGGRLRVPLFAWCERLAWRATLAIVLPIAALGALLWWWLPPAGVPGLFLLVSTLTMSVAAMALGLMQVRRAGFADAVVGLMILASWWMGVVAPLFEANGRPDRLVIVAQIAVAVLAREIARARWRRTDWARRTLPGPRAFPSP